MKVGLGLPLVPARGARWWKCWKSKRDKASAMQLSLTSPVGGSKGKGMTSCTKRKGRKKNHHVRILRRSPNVVGWPLAILSEQNSTCFVAQRWPHKWDATTTGNNSLYAIGKGFWREDHSPTNHSLSKMAPYPSAPAASEETWNSGKGAHWGRAGN